MRVYKNRTGTPTECKDFDPLATAGEIAIWCNKVWGSGEMVRVENQWVWKVEDMTIIIRRNGAGSSLQVPKERPFREVIESCIETWGSGSLHAIFGNYTWVPLGEILTKPSGIDVGKLGITLEQADKAAEAFSNAYPAVENWLKSKDLSYLDAREQAGRQGAEAFKAFNEKYPNPDAYNHPEVKVPKTEKPDPKKPSLDEIVKTVIMLEEAAVRHGELRVENDAASDKVYKLRQEIEAMLKARAS